MFISHFVPIEGSAFSEVERASLEVLRELPEAADFAYRKGEDVRVRRRLGHTPVDKTVRVHPGNPLRREQQTTLPITWEATGTPGLFPKMEADLVVSSLGPDLVHLALRGSYRPPLGPVGALLDRAVLHRLAELSVLTLLERLAALISERAVVGTASPNVS